MTRNKGFTLIELMVVILIIAILAAVIAPMMHGRIDSAKWSEGRAGCGSIATAARAWWAEHQDELDDATGGTGPTLVQLFPTAADLDGKYFQNACYEINWTTYKRSSIAFSVTCTADTSKRSGKPTSPATMTLTVNADGTTAWSQS